MHCDGCGMQKTGEGVRDGLGFTYCDECADRRADDPTIQINGRMLPYSELAMQAEDDEHLANALQGDSVQEQRR